MIYLLKNDLYFEDTSSDNSVDIIDSESTEEIGESSSVSSNDSVEITEEDSENSEEPAESSSEESAEFSSEESADSSSDESVVYYQTVSNTNISYNGITPPMFVDSMSICIFLLAVILGVALFGIFRSKL